MKVKSVQVVQHEGSVDSGSYYALEAQVELQDGSSFPVSLRMPEHQYNRLMLENILPEDYAEPTGLTKSMKALFEQLAGEEIE
jgi:hypothetical protein